MQLNLLFFARLAVHDVPVALRVNHFFSAGVSLCNAYASNGLKEFVSNMIEMKLRETPITMLKKKSRSAKCGKFFLCLPGKYNIIQRAKLMKIASGQMWPIRHDWQILKHLADSRWRNHAGASALAGLFFCAGCFSSS